MALKSGGLDFAAGQRHSLENPLIPECRFLILLFRRAAALDCILLARVQILFSHKKELPLPRAQSPRAGRRTPTTSDCFREAYHRNRIKPIITFGTGQKANRAPRYRWRVKDRIPFLRRGSHNTRRITTLAQSQSRMGAGQRFVGVDQVNPL